MRCPDCGSADVWTFHLNLPSKRRMQCLACGARFAYFPDSSSHVYRCETLACRLSWLLMSGGQHACIFSRPSRYYTEETRTGRARLLSQ